MLSYSLEGKNRAELNTEIRFQIATARAEKIELVEFSVQQSTDTGLVEKLTGLITKILNSMQREGAIQFFATPKGFKTRSTEAEFLINKYFEKIKYSDENTLYFYVKNL